MKNNLKSTKIKLKYLFLCCIVTLFFYFYIQGYQQAKKYFISWIRVQMSSHRYNNLAELNNEDLAAKMGR